MSVSEQKVPLLSSELQEELQRLAGHGYTLIPLGGIDGKAPKLRDWAKSKVKLSQCKAIMNRAGSQTYGVRLDDMLVLDVDTQAPELIEELEERFGPAQVKVRSPRGTHLYYAAGSVVPALRGEGLPVDVKTGPHEFMVGPNSCRPDGGHYSYIEGRLGETKLTPLRINATADKGAASSHQKTPEVGNRHVWLRSAALKMAEIVRTLDELIANLEASRDEFPDPGSMSNSEVRGIAEWVWQLRLENRLYVDRNSVVKIDRRAIDALRMEPDALVLYVTLWDAHGHTHAKRFALSYPGMAASKRIALSRDRFRAARDTLIKKGLLQLVAKHQAKKRSQQFVLCRLPPVGQGQQNVALIQFGQD